MDDPALDPVLHRQALRALRRVNWISGTTGRIWRAVQELNRALGAGVHAGSAGVDRDAAPTGTRPIRILDVACGGGEVLVALGRRAARSGIAVELHGCDVSPTALDRAQEAASEAGVTITGHHADVLRDPLPRGFHLVTSTLFLHHLEGSDVVGLLGRMRAAGESGVIQDLIRSPLGYALAWTGLRVLSRSPVAHVDGPRSVEAGFSLAEVRSIADQAGMPDARLDRVWPERLLLRWGQAA